MSILLSRPLPPSGTPTRYEVYQGVSPSTLMLLDTVPFPGSNQNAQGFFYITQTGTTADWYQIIAYDVNNVILDDSGPYAFSPNTAALTPTTIMVNQNFGGTDALRYVTPSGMGIAQATIRIWTLADFQQGLYQNAAAATFTDDEGRWVTPVFLQPNSYEISFFKEGCFGPDNLSIVVGPS